MYFAKKKYSPIPIPRFEVSRGRLPSPVLEDHSDWIEMYWKCWEIGFQHFIRPQPGSPFVSDYLDAAFNGNLYQWDTVFMVMFARYAHKEFPAVQSLDNFYCKQDERGYICREIFPDGRDCAWMGRGHSINPPLFSWAEVESFKVTGDKSRFAMVLPPLEKYVEWLNREGQLGWASNEEWFNHGRRAPSGHQLFWNTPLGSGMDNTPRSGDGWVDMSCQMVIQYNDLAVICDELNLPDKAAKFRAEGKSIAQRIQKYCWNEQDGFFYDVDSNSKQVRLKTVGGFWPMLAEVATPAQAKRLVEHLKNPKEFWRPNIFPSLAADEKQYQPNGSYWLGATWAPTNFMIVKGLEKYGYEDFAVEATEKYLDAMYKTLQTTGTVWENYAPESFEPGDPAKPDFVGWSGDGPIAMLIENVLGFRVDGVRSKLTWRINRTPRHGIERLTVGPAMVSAVCERRADLKSPAKLSVTTDRPVELKVILNGKESVFPLLAGNHSLTVG